MEDAAVTAMARSAVGQKCPAFFKVDQLRGLPGSSGPSQSKAGGGLEVVTCGIVLDGSFSRSWLEVRSVASTV